MFSAFGKLCPNRSMNPGPGPSRPPACPAAERLPGRQKSDPMADSAVSATKAPMWPNYKHPSISRLRSSNDFKWLHARSEIGAIQKTSAVCKREQDALCTSLQELLLRTENVGSDRSPAVG